MESSFEGLVGSVGATIGVATNTVSSGASSVGEIGQDVGRDFIEGTTVFESPIEGEAVFGQEVDADADAVEDFAPERQIMDIPGTAHEKLEVLASTKEPVIEIPNSAQLHPEPSVKKYKDSGGGMSYSKEGQRVTDEQELEALIKKLKVALEALEKAS